MTASPNPLLNLFEQNLGLTDDVASSPAIDSAPLAEEQESVAHDAGKLAEICSRLRTSSQIEPRPDLWERLQERIKLYQELGTVAPVDEWENLPDVHAGSEEVPFTDVFELCSGLLEDDRVPHVEQQLATSAETPKQLRAAGRLSAVLVSLRRESQVPAADDAWFRFQQNLPAALQSELSEVSGDWNALSPAWQATAQELGWVPAVEVASQPVAESFTIQVNEKPRRSRRSSSWLVLAASLLVAACVWKMLDLSATSPGVFSKVAQVQQAEDLRGLSRPLASAMGQALASLDETNPPSTVDLANLHLLVDISRHASTPEDLATARFLSQQLPASWKARWHSTTSADQTSAIPFLSSPVYAGSTFDRNPTLENHLKAGNFAEVAKLTADADGLGLRLLHLWAIAQANQASPAQRLLNTLEADGSQRWPLSAQVFLAGLHRTLQQPQTAIDRLEKLLPQAPDLAFQIAQIYDRNLDDAWQAAQWYGRSSKEFSQFGLQQTKVVELFYDNFHGDLAQWQRSELGRGSYSILPEASRDVLHQTEMASLPDVASLVVGQRDWQNYEIRFDFRLDNVSIGEPRLGVFGYYLSEEDNYRLSIGRDSLGFRRREGRSWGGYETVAWPKAEPSHPTIPLGTWHTVRFRLETQVQPSGKSHTRLLAKVWPRQAAEPAAWQLASEDPHATPYTSGRVGLLISNCQASISDFRVIATSR